MGRRPTCSRTPSQPPEASAPVSEPREPCLNSHVSPACPSPGQGARRLARGGEVNGCSPAAESSRLRRAGTATAEPPCGGGPICANHPPGATRDAARGTALRAAASASVVDTTPWVCAARTGVCPVVVGDTAVQRDGSHLSEAYAEALAPGADSVAGRLDPSVVTGLDRSSTLWVHTTFEHVPVRNYVLPHRIMPRHRAPLSPTRPICPIQSGADDVPPLPPTSHDPLTGICVLPILSTGSSDQGAAQ